MKSARNVTKTVENNSAGIQNKNVFRGLFLIRTAAKNNAKNKDARIHSKGEEKPRLRTSTPIAVCPLNCLNTGHRTTRYARKIAANPERMALR